MKVNKIFCDVCSNEINIEVDEALGMFEFIQVQNKINIVPVFPLQRDSGATDINKEITKTSLDLCKKCAVLVEKFMQDKKEEFSKKVDKN